MINSTVTVKFTKEALSICTGLYLHQNLQKKNFWMRNIFYNRKSWTRKVLSGNLATNYYVIENFIGFNWCYWKARKMTFKKFHNQKILSLNGVKSFSLTSKSKKNISYKNTNNYWKDSAPSQLRLYTTTRSTIVLLPARSDYNIPKLLKCFIRWISYIW